MQVLLIIMQGDPTIFDEPHHHALELLATRALASGDAETAFVLADRRCRIKPAPTAHCLVLRAEASYRMGATAAAISDLDLALEISPADVVINRRMLAWSRGKRRRAAAAAILAADHDIVALRSALSLMRSDGPRHGGRGGARSRRSALEGRPSAWASIAVLDNAIQAGRHGRRGTTMPRSNCRSPTPPAASRSPSSRNAIIH